MLAAGQLPAFAATPTVTIAATSAFAPVSGDVYVYYRSGTNSNATISGDVAGAVSGEVATLYAQPFPYTAAAAPVGAPVTLNPTGTDATYSFSATPALATRYTVEVFATSTDMTPLVTSAVQQLYVAAGGRVSGTNNCGRPTCREYLTLRMYVPASALKTEMAKHVYPYFAVNLGGTKVPAEPKYAYLNGGKAKVGKATKVSNQIYSLKLKYKFSVGNHSYNWVWTVCTKDAVTKDGLGLPGTHSCGNKRIRSSVTYLG